MKVKFVKFSKLTKRNLSDWYELSYHAEPNVFATFEFITAAVLAYEKDPLMLLVHDIGDRLVVIGAFERVLGTRVFPFPHLVSFMTEHSFSSGLMIRSDCKFEAMDAVVDMLTDWYSPLGGIEMPKAYALSDTVSCLTKAAQNMYRDVDLASTYTRPALRIKNRTEQELKAMIGSKRVSDNARNQRKLNALGQGEVSWRFINGDIPDRAIQTFLDIENTGWKKEERSALANTDEGIEFFEQLIRNFAKSNRVIFTELCLGDRVIASTVNFTIQNVGFAFKIAVDDEFKKFSVGIMNEIEFMKNAGTAAPSIEIMDSCAGWNSFMEGLWTEDEIEVGTLVIPTSVAAGAVYEAAVKYRAYKNVEENILTQ